MSKLALRPAVAALAGILIAIGGCAESPSAPDAAAVPTVVSAPSFAVSSSSTAAVIGSAGGTLQAGGHKVFFPAGALSQPTLITMTVSGAGIGVEMGPHGTVFPASAQPVLTLDVAGTDLRGYRSVSIGYFDEAGQVYEVLSTEVIGNGNKLRASLPHFSKLTVVGT